MPLIYDVIHGHIHIENRNLKFIDNRWMKRLKRIKQLGLLDHVFTSASHTRYEHALGVYHLATKYMEHLEKNSETSSLFSDKEKRCVLLAALFHDLGHGPFSHVFDDSVIKDMDISTEFKHHEGRSLWMVEQIFLELRSSDFTRFDIDMIKNMIEPNESILYTNEHGTTIYNVDKPYLYQIVNNKTSGLDVDKFDYLQRDTYHIGLDYSFSHERIFHKSKVCPDTLHIIYNSSIMGTLYEMFYTRYRLHKDIYNHPTAKLIELMLADALILSTSKYNFTDIQSFISLDDSIYNNILFDTSSSSAIKAASILQNIDTRDLYSCLYYGPRKQQEIILENTNSDKALYKISLNFNLCNNFSNPLDNIVFYNTNKNRNHSSRLLHERFNEEIVMYYQK